MMRVQLLWSAGLGVEVLQGIPGSAAVSHKSDLSRMQEFTYQTLSLCTW